MADVFLASHPYKGIMIKAQTNRYFNFGPENLRYTKQVTKETACDSINGGIWLFGGSTMIKAGVLDGETIASYLNEFLPNEKVINSGQGSFRQSHEIKSYYFC